MDLSSGALWGALFAIIVANILLSVDNAVVIAMAARSLPVGQQRTAIVWGTAGAICLRVALTVVAVEVLDVPYLQIAGALALLWIGAQLLVAKEDDDQIAAHGTLLAAIRTILLADAVMSIDNVIAVASAADRAPAETRLLLLVVGLATSIPLIVAGSTMLMKVMQRFPIIVTLGAGLLGWLAGGLFATDPAVEPWFKKVLPGAEWILGAAGAAIVVVAGQWLHHRARRPEAA